MVDAERLCADLLTWQGVPFRHQGRTRAGVDCVGLPLAALAAQGVVIDAPDNYAPSAAAALLLATLGQLGQLVPRLPLNAPDAGDVLVLRIRREPQHLAIALGPDRMIHATQSAGVAAVTISPLWRERVAARYGWGGNG